jgi:hypothetical protein
MAELNPQPLPPVQDIRISVPAAVLNDLGAFQRAQASVLAQAGCPSCTSGLNLNWEPYTHFTVDPGGEVRPVIGGEIAAPGA